MPKKPVDPYQVEMVFQDTFEFADRVIDFGEPEPTGQLELGFSEEKRWTTKTQKLTN